jgi:hypothetical protein
MLRGVNETASSVGVPLKHTSRLCPLKPEIGTLLGASRFNYLQIENYLRYLC